MTEPHIALPREAEELLRDFPMTEPDFEAQARAISARLQAPQAASADQLSDDDLFKAPGLSAEATEPPLPSQVRAAPKSSLAELARRSLHKPEDDSAALAKELLAATAQSRRPNAELVERMRAASKSAPTSTPLPTSEPRGERNSGVVHRASAEPSVVVAPAAAAQKPANDRRGLLIAVAGVALAAAAAFALFSGRAPESSTTSATLAAERAAAAETEAQAAKAPAAPAVVAAMPDRTASPDALPPVEASSPELVARGKQATAGGSKPAASAAASAAPPSREVVQLTDDPEPEALAVKPKAELAPEPALRPAEGNAGSVPLSPSAGAVSTALSSVRSGAQACLAGQTEAVTATVTFASDGHVLRVSAPGASGACIQAALSKARIAPFAKESFSATTTVRPP